ncbi:MAG: elongation factor Ts [Alphaproteobacteria bacterium]|nr:elongation factor Ts [Alphaproteobacteria bacterium]
MANITAALVKSLRDKTGAGMMDCKKALTETEGDIETAVDWLRKKGLSMAAKKAGRVAAEGLVGVVVDGKTGAVAEVNAETDFVARNDDFQAFVRNVTSIALTNGESIDALAAAAYPGSDRSVADELTHQIATIGENMALRRCVALAVNDGVVVPYVHGALGEGIGKIGVIVALESEGDKAALEALGKQIAMHIAAARPEFVAVADIDENSLARERDVLTEQARASGRPEEIIEKMVEGRLRKYYEEVALLEQVFVIDNETKVSKVLENAAKELGKPVALKAFVRFALGEGIEKVEESLADEVAATLAG